MDGVASGSFRSGWREGLARRVPGFGVLFRAFGRLAAWRVGRLPVGLLALLPVALALDLFDAGDEAFGGPVGMAASFVVQTAFLLGVTGMPSLALAFSGIDLVPLVDVIPFCTLVLVRQIARALRAPRSDPLQPEGPVIDV